MQGAALPRASGERERERERDGESRERAVLILHSSGRAAVKRQGLIHGNPNAISHGALR